MHTARCVSCEGGLGLIMCGQDWWCADCRREGRHDTYAEAAMLVASIVAERGRRTHDVALLSRCR